MRGRYQGLYGMTFSSGAIFGPALGTLLYAHVETGFWGLCGAFGLLAALLVLATRPGRGRATTRIEPPTGGTVLLSEPVPADEIRLVFPEPDVARRDP